MTIADTDVLIDYLAGRADAASQVVIELERGTLQTTVITQFELLAGARSPKQRETILQLLAAIPAISLDPGAADRASQVRRFLEARGESIGMGDCLIAGIVLQHGAILATRNRRHFERVPGLGIAGPHVS
jgi:tRNA(fMet)-specific endonuclease VapC